MPTETYFLTHELWLDLLPLDRAEIREAVEQAAEQGLWVSPQIGELDDGEVYYYTTGIFTEREVSSYLNAGGLWHYEPATYILRKIKEWSHEE